MGARRKRKGGAQQKKDGPRKQKERREKAKEAAPRSLLSWLVVALVWVAPIYLSIGAYQEWGFYFFVPLFLRDLGFTPEKWQALLQNHTVILIGGPHRGGTTVLWETFRKHPMVSDFGNQRESGLDYSEGIFTQDVYPRFSIGFERTRGEREMVGLGRFALASEEKVHWTYDHPKVTPANQARLLNRFGWYWDLDKEFLLEKSPTNAVLSTFLQSLLNLGNAGWNSDLENFGSVNSVVKFIFISRDPWANSYAHKALTGVNGKMEELLENWLKVHEYMEADTSKLQFVKVIKLEDFEKTPASIISELWDWVGLPGPFDKHAALASANVKPSQNQKYVAKHCRLLRQPSAMDHFQYIVKRLNDRVKALKLVDYDLNSSLWNCKTSG